MPEEIVFKGVNQNIGTFSSYPPVSDKRVVKARYDRKNFYPTILLESKGFPTTSNDVKHLVKVGEVRLLTVRISGVRKQGRRGIFLNEQYDVVNFEELTLFKEELDTVIRNEFHLKEFKILKTERLPLYPVPPKLEKLVSRLIRQKEKFRYTRPDKYREVKDRLNKNVGLAHQTPNGIFDGLSLSYLKSISRIEMYNSMNRYHGIVLGNFIDEVRATERIPEFENDKVHWRKLGY